MSRIAHIPPIGDKYSAPKWWRLIQTELMSRKAKKEKGKSCPGDLIRTWSYMCPRRNDIRPIFLQEVWKNKVHKRGGRNWTYLIHFLGWDLGNKTYANCQISAESIWKNSWNLKSGFKLSSFSPHQFHASEMCIFDPKMTPNPIIWSLTLSNASPWTLLPTNHWLTEEAWNVLRVKNEPLVWVYQLLEYACPLPQDSAPLWNMHTPFIY